MHLTPCNRPPGPLEPAPCTSLREAAAGEHWEGFWCLADERHYSRCVGRNGDERWFRIADHAEAARLTSRRKRPNGIPFPVAGGVPRMIVGRYRGQAMLVGTRRRREPSGEAR